MVGELTKALRAAATDAEMSYSKGYLLKGRRVDTDNVTTLWPVKDKPLLTLTFEEVDGELFCEDSMTVNQAIAMAEVARNGR